MSLLPGVQALTRKAYRSADDHKALLERLAGYRSWLEEVPAQASEDDPSPRWINGSFPALDAVSLYGLLALNNPSVYVEVGSGNSTIDPHPRQDIDLICDQVIRTACEDVDMTFFTELPGDAMLFVDNSHRAFQNSRRHGLLHGNPAGASARHRLGTARYLPCDHPEAWHGRFFNEQYLLMSYLMGGGGADEILLPNGLISSSPTLMPSALAIFEGAQFDGIEKHGGCFWMKRGTQK